MDDNEKYDDEYTYVDADSTGVDPLDYTADANPQPADSAQPSLADRAFAGKSVVVRSALIVVVLIITVMLVYPFVRSHLVSQKKTSMVNTMSSKKPVHQFQPTKPVQVATKPVVEVNEVNNIDSKVSEKISTLESSQQQMQNEIAASNNQLSGMNNNINEVMSKLTELNNTIAQYASKVDEQSREIAKLTAEAEAMKKAKAPPKVKHTTTQAPITYYLQAVIPGRAWLSKSNGSTLTVREGSTIAGLGMVKLIDAKQGRVITSSGRVIRFSQDDS